MNHNLHDSVYHYRRHCKFVFAKKKENALPSEYSIISEQFNKKAVAHTKSNSNKRQHRDGTGCKVRLVPFSFAIQVMTVHSTAAKAEVTEARIPFCKRVKVLWLSTMLRTRIMRMGPPGV